MAAGAKKGKRQGKSVAPAKRGAKPAKAKKPAKIAKPAKAKKAARKIGAKAAPAKRAAKRRVAAAPVAAPVPPRAPMSREAVEEIVVFSARSTEALSDAALSEVALASDLDPARVLAVHERLRQEYADAEGETVVRFVQFWDTDE